MVDIDIIKALFKEKKYQEIKSLLQNESNDDNAEVLYILGMIANENKDYQKAFNYFYKASKLAHNEAERV